MLRTLRIRQLVIIEDLTVEFDEGLNLLTGETGAGKSILVDALGIALGDRADRGLVRSGKERAIVEALFETPDGWLTQPAEEHGLPDLGDADQVLIRREVAAEGRGRIYINGSPSTRTQLREIGTALLELHGQHEHQGLLSTERQLDLLDRHGGHRSLLEQVSREYAAVIGARDRRAELRTRAAERDERLLELRRIVEEIDGFAPRDGELAELDRERRLLQSSARVTELLDELVLTTYEGDTAAAGLAAAAARKAAELAELDETLSELAERLAAASVELQDAGAAFRDYRDRADFDPARLEHVEERRVGLERLCLAYGKDERAILERAEEARLELDALQSVGRELDELDAAVSAAETRYIAASRKLSAARRTTALGLIRAVQQQLAALALEKARFAIDFTPARGTAVAGTSEEVLPLNARGVERVAFLLAANPGEPQRPLSKVASGGELSRIMLALHVVAEDSSGSRALVFDEVDSGVGGAVADAVGARLARLAERHQVLCVTHLPQVAAYADRHYVVRKRIVNGRTRAEITSLSDEQRVDELARMLGGKQATIASRRHASELLDSAGRGGSGRTA